MVVEHEAAPIQEVQQVDFRNGEFDSVLFLGPLGCKHWDHIQLTTIYWVAPQMGHIVMLRYTTDIKVVDVFTHISGIRSYMEGMSDQIMVNPIITFRGVEVLTLDRLSNHSNNDTFLIFDGVVPELYLKHRGKLYQCSVCNKAWTCRKSVGTSCKKGRNHKILFSEILNEERIRNWGSNLDRHDRCYGCPRDNTSTGTATKVKQKAQQEPLHPAQQQPQQPDVAQLLR